MCLFNGKLHRHRFATSHKYIKWNYNWKHFSLHLWRTFGIWTPDDVKLGQTIYASNGWLWKPANFFMCSRRPNNSCWLKNMQPALLQTALRGVQSAGACIWWWTFPRFRPPETSWPSSGSCRNSLAARGVPSPPGCTPATDLDNRTGQHWKRMLRST